MRLVTVAGLGVAILGVACSGTRRPIPSETPHVTIAGRTCQADSAARASLRAPVLCAEAFVRQHADTQLIPTAAWLCRGAGAFGFTALFRYDSAWAATQPQIRLPTGVDSVDLLPRLARVVMTAHLDSLVLAHQDMPADSLALLRAGCLPLPSPRTDGRQSN